MPWSDEAAIGRITAQVESLREDIHEIRKQSDARHHRLRSVESAVSLMLEAQKEARRREETQYRRIEVRMQVLTVMVGIASTVVPIALAVVLR